jgi:DNA-binding MarR family transcriptional regulator
MNIQQEIIGLYLKSVEGMKTLENRKWILGDVTLYSSQMHALRAIGLAEEINLTDLAYKLGITKAGVAKFVKKLQAYGFIEKYTKEDNRKEVYFRLTHSGQDAFVKHEAFSNAVFGEIYSILDNLSDKDLDIAKNIFTRINMIIDKNSNTLP